MAGGQRNRPLVAPANILTGGSDLSPGHDRRAGAGPVPGRPALNARIRPACPDDLPRINAIYNHYVTHSPASYDVMPMTDALRRDWWTAHEGVYPVLVAESEAGVVGWASLSQYRGRPGYRFTVENSVFLQPDVHRFGLGTRLLNRLLTAGRAAGFHTVLACIESSQTPSIRLHLRAGYRQVGVLEQVGWKFDRWLDTLIFQRHL